jgi:hypothetical protein
MQDFCAWNSSKIIDNDIFSSTFLLKDKNSIQSSILIDVKNSNFFNLELAIHIY